MIDLNEVYKSVLEADKAAVVICDLDHKIIYMNPASICRYEKWGGKDLIGKSLLECHNEKENKDVYMVALRNEAGELIAYYEKHEYRNRETMAMYNMD